MIWHLIRIFLRQRIHTYPYLLIFYLARHSISQRTLTSNFKYNPFCSNFNNIIFSIERKKLTSEVFLPPARASGFELRKFFSAAQNTTCRVPVNTRIRPSERITVTREKQLKAVSLPFDLCSHLCLNLFTIIILQSKNLLQRVSPGDT